MGDSANRALLRRAAMGDADAATGVLGSLVRSGTLEVKEWPTGSRTHVPEEMVLDLELDTWALLKGGNGEAAALLASRAATACALRAVRPDPALLESVRALAETALGSPTKTAVTELVERIYRHGPHFAGDSAADALCRASCMIVLSRSYGSREREALFRRAQAAHREATADERGPTLVPSALAELATYLREGPDPIWPFTIHGSAVDCLHAAAKVASASTTRIEVGVALACWALGRPFDPLAEWSSRRSKVKQHPKGSSEGRRPRTPRRGGPGRSNSSGPSTSC